ncbi:MAG: hypothetical protein JF616_17730 [Fibrobacteres bacterium]|jgi:hypothetical protein|nr:hypothetical protein [Fibrobacterota bacterium]
MDAAIVFRTEPRSFKLAFQDEAAVNIAEINDEILDSVGKYGERAVLGYTKKGRAVTFEELARNGITSDLPSDGSSALRILTFDFKEEKLFVLDRQSAVPLARLRLTVAYRAVPAEPAAAPEAKPLDPEDDDYTLDVFVKRKED